MKESFWGLFVIVLGLVGLAVLGLLQNITSTNEQNYYLLKEIAEAAMLDSVDLGYYRREGEIAIVEEKFVESFTRRFAASQARNKTYVVRIYEVQVSPPRVSLLVNVAENLQIINKVDVDFNVDNRVDAILETKYSDYDY